MNKIIHYTAPAFVYGSEDLSHEARPEEYGLFTKTTEKPRRKKTKPTPSPTPLTKTNVEHSVTPSNEVNKIIQPLYAWLSSFN